MKPPEPSMSRTVTSTRGSIGARLRLLERDVGDVAAEARTAADRPLSRRAGVGRPLGGHDPGAAHSRVAPSGPGGRAEPWVPCGPWRPSAPFRPGAPCGPCGPGVPAGPAGPCRSCRPPCARGIARAGRALDEDVRSRQHALGQLALAVERDQLASFWLREALMPSTAPAFVANATRCRPRPHRDPSNRARPRRARQGRPQEARSFAFRSVSFRGPPFLARTRPREKAES